MASSKKFTFHFFKIAENFWFLILLTRNKQWWIAKKSTFYHAKLRRK